MEKQAKDLVKEDLVVLNASKNLALSMSVRLSLYVKLCVDRRRKYKESFDEYRKMAEENNAILDKYEKSDERDQLVAIARDWSTLVNTEVFDIYQKGNKELALENLMDTHELVTKVRYGYENWQMNALKPLQMSVMMLYQLALRIEQLVSSLA